MRLAEQAVAGITRPLAPPESPITAQMVANRPEWTTGALDGYADFTLYLPMRLTERLIREGMVAVEPTTLDDWAKNLVRITWKPS